MIWFKSRKRKKIEELLKLSKQNFEFDQEGVKTNLITSVNIRHLSKDDIKLLTFRPKIWPRYAFSLSLAGVLLVSTSGFAFASNKAAPGDVLFRLQKFQNNVVLSLPMPETKREEILTDIVAKRLKELDAIQNNPNVSKAKVQAAIEESQKSIDQAITNLPVLNDGDESDNETNKENNLNDKKIQKYNALIDLLDDLSKRHEERMEAIKNQIEDKDIKAMIDTSVISVKSSRAKLRKDRTGEVKGKFIPEETDKKDEKTEKSQESNSKNTSH